MKSIKAYLQQNSKQFVSNVPKEQTSVSNNFQQIGDIFVIDAMNLFIRNFSISTILDKRANHIGGLVGSLNSIYSIIRKFRPKRIIIIFEGDNSTLYRKKIYKEYKSQRKGKGVTNKAVFFNEDEAEESFDWQLLTFIQYLQNLPINLLSVEGYEADDVIGWLVTKSSLSGQIFETNSKIIDTIFYDNIETNFDDEMTSKGDKFVIISSDGDYLQLVSNNVTVFSPTKKIMYTMDEVYREFGLHSYNFLLYKTLIGDKSDNIVGVKGLQLKTLLKIFPNISNEEQICLQDLLEFCNTKMLEKKPYKIYGEIISSQDLIQLNEKLMDLCNVNIPKILVNEIEENLSQKFEPNLVECVVNSEKHYLSEHLFKSPQEFFNEFLYLNL